MEIQELFIQLEALANEKRKKSYVKDDPTYTGFGVMAGELRKIAKKIKRDHELAKQLWASGNSDARVIAAMIFDPEQLNTQECEQLICSCQSYRSHDELIAHTLSQAQAAQTLAEKWWDSDDEFLARAGWSLVVAKIINKKELEKIPSYLTKIEREMQQAKGKHQDVMNRALCEIGIRYPEYTERCLAIGEKLGVYKDVKVAKGCTSPYALEWIPAGIRNREARQKPMKKPSAETDPLMTETASAYVRAETISDYIQVMSPLRQQKIEPIIRYITQKYPEAQQELYHGPHMSIPMFVIGNDSVSFASQKNYLSLYFSNREVLPALVAANPKIQRQTGCVNIRDSVMIPMEALYQAIDQTFHQDKPNETTNQLITITEDPEVEAAVCQYVNAQTPLRQERIQVIIQYILDTYPQAVPTMDYGPKTKIPTFKIGEMYVAIASVKSHLTIHFGRYGATKIVAEAHPKIKANVGCVNIPDTVDLPIKQIKKAIKYTLSADSGVSE
ncbi:MAG: DNA alkylation repair protein [Culicoidibacterales bacterium]